MYFYLWLIRVCAVRIEKWCIAASKQNDKVHCQSLYPIAAYSTVLGLYSV